MLRFLPVAAAVAGVLGDAAWAQTLPPGYQGVIQITNDNLCNSWPSINNHGQIVFAKRSDPYNEQTTDIYLYDNGVLTRLTDDDIRDDFPDINDAGEIVWSRAIGGRGLGNLEIVLWRQGQLTRLTYDELDDYADSINNLGWVCWSKDLDVGCANGDADIYLYDAQTIHQITFGGYSNQYGCLNDLGDLVWTRFNFCNQPWTSEIMLRSEGVTVALTGNQGEPRAPRINNRRLIGWLAQDPPSWNHRIMLWQNGVGWELTDWGSGLRMNDRGHIVFDRWHEDTHTWQVWFYRDGQLWQLTNDPFWNFVGDINEYGDITWMSGSASALQLDIKWLKRFPAGDVNCDGAVNTFDIGLFVHALTVLAPGAAGDPRCDYLLADVNLDGQVNAFDIDLFVQLLLP